MTYFDYNATSPLSPVARQAWLEAVDNSWQNPSSVYRESVRVRVLLEKSRERLGELLGCDPSRIIFTSGATEGVNAIFAGYGRKFAAGGRSVLLSPTEHPCVTEAAKRFFAGRRGWLRIDSAGQVDLEAFWGMLEQEKCLIVSTMAANNETGLLQPWGEIQDACSQQGVLYHCDASQWIGKLPADGIGQCDFVTASAHKFGGPKGVGILIVPADIYDFHSFVGGPQERGIRAGTEDYPGIAAMVAAFEEAERLSKAEATGRASLREQFEGRVNEQAPGVRIVADGSPRLWNTTLLIMPRFENTRWVRKLDRLGFAVSTGSACSAGNEAPSYVLAAMGFLPEESKRAIRISSSWNTTAEDWLGLADAIAAAWQEMTADNEETSTHRCD